MFKECIRDTMEVYIGDIMFKGLTREDHTKRLDKAFKILREPKIMLNLAKCTFGILAGKYLGFIITQWEIEPCPN